MAGLGLADYLNESTEVARGGSGGGGGRSLNWKKDGKAILWMATQARPVVYFKHEFMFEDVGDERDADGKKTGRTTQFLRYPRFIGPDDRAVYMEQYFRDRDTDELQRPPRRDVFLILREYLRRQIKAGALATDVPVFEWTDHRQKKIITWESGVLSKLVKGGPDSYRHTLDAKFEGLYAMVDNAAIDRGPQLLRESKSVVEALNAMLKQQMSMRGEEEGDPTLTPYPICFEIDKKAPPASMYKVYRYEGRDAPYTDAVYNAISSEDLPDLDAESKPSPGDEDKIRAAMEAAAKIAIPFDDLFSDDLDRRAALMRAPRPGGAVATAKKAATPPATPGAARPAVAPPPAASSRTRKPAAAPAAPPTPPPVATEPCADCGYDLPVTATKCPQCGAEYEIDDAPAPTPPPAAKAAPAPAADPSGSPPPAKCMACGSRNFARNADGDWACLDCGIVEDALPF